MPRARVESVLDSAPLRASLGAQVDFPQIAANVTGGSLDAAGVVATSVRTGRSVVFYGANRRVPEPPPDTRRGIDYVPTVLQEEHVLASSAIPSVFPAVRVEHPEHAAGWYVDGGTRLNTPIKPALNLGAVRVVVVGLTPLAQTGSVPGPDVRPDVLTGAAQALIGLLSDQLTADVQTLATINQLAPASAGAPSLGGAATNKRRVPYIAITPATPNAIAQRALEIARARYDGALSALGAPDVTLLTRLVSGAADLGHAQLLSFLLFAGPFASALVELGAADARAWIAADHEVDGLWQVSPSRSALVR